MDRSVGVKKGGGFAHRSRQAAFWCGRIGGGGGIVLIKTPGNDGGRRGEHRDQYKSWLDIKEERRRGGE